MFEKASSILERFRRLCLESGQIQRSRCFSVVIPLIGQRGFLVLENEGEPSVIWNWREPKIASNSNGSDKRGKVSLGSRNRFLEETCRLGVKSSSKMTVSEDAATDNVGETTSNIKLTVLQVLTQPTNK